MSLNPCGCALNAMEPFFTRFKNPLVLIAIVVAQVIALAMQVQRPLQARGAGLDISSGTDTRSVAWVRRWAVALVTPLERVTDAGSEKVKSAWLDYVDLRHTRDQDKQLQQAVARLREEQAAFAEDAAQGRRLQKLLDFREKYISATVAAQVIGTSGSDRSHLLYLDKGWAEGLRPDQAVITPEGIVGKLRDVFPHTAQVLLINDASSGAGVVLASSRIRGILRGTTSGQVEINNLTADSRIKPGEPVLTSGGDMVYPRGLPVGVIQAINPDPSHQPYTAILIKPAASLQQLSEVLVITGVQSNLSPAAQADADQAEAAAEANQRAADMLAEKLPSLHETPASGTAQPGSPAVAGQPATQPGNGAQPGNATQPGTGAQPDSAAAAGGSDTPKPQTIPPQPILHPDRFTPGTTPPATDLTPGGGRQPATPDPTAAEPPQSTNGTPPLQR